MRIAIIGRSELLFSTAKELIDRGFEIPLIITAKEAPEYKITSADYKELAASINADFMHTAKINKAEVVEKIKSLGKIDLAISINYSGIIAQEVIDLFPIGILNAHGGDLPRYRGNACQAWAIINGEDKIGLCIHKMIGDELDSGEIIERAYLPININTKIGEVWNWMEKEIVHLMLKAVDNLKSNPSYFLEKQSEDPKDALRCYPRKPEDGKIDWQMSNETVLRLINASSAPYAGAYCFLADKKVIISNAELVTEFENYCGVPGQVSRVNNNEKYIEVLCGQGKILITEVIYDEKSISPTELINSIRLRLS